MTSPTIPTDAVLMPLAEGRLLVSPGHALFCPVPGADLPAVQDVIDGSAESARLPATLLDELARHGFGGLPREPEPAAPSVQIQLTNACNLECTYCCTNSGQPRSE